MDKVNNRLKYNRKIVNKLLELIEKYPNLRFGQLIVNCDIIKYDKDVFVVGQRENVLIIDPFHDESELIWDRMCKSKICNYEKL